MIHGTLTKYLGGVVEWIYPQLYDFRELTALRSQIVSRRNALG